MRFFGRKGHPSSPGANTPSGDLRCSFCNKSQRYVRQLIAGPAVYICDECVDICVDVIAHHQRQRDDEADADNRVSDVPANCALCRLPMFAGDGLYVENRGALCVGCVSAVQAALATVSSEA